MTQTQPSVRVAGRLPRWSSVLAVVAHPDDESFGLGAILDSFTRAGSAVAVLCLTHGEASALGPAGDLGALLAKEVQAAAGILGVDTAILLDYPDGALATVDPNTLKGEILERIRESEADGLLVFDRSGVSGHSDHSAATAAALAAAG